VTAAETETWKFTTDTQHIRHAHVTNMQFSLRLMVSELQTDSNSTKFYR